MFNKLIHDFINKNLIQYLKQLNENPQLNGISIMINRTNKTGGSCRKRQGAVIHPLTAAHIPDSDVPAWHSLHARLTISRPEKTKQHLVTALVTGASSH